MKQFVFMIIVLLIEYDLRLPPRHARHIYKDHSISEGRTDAGTIRSADRR